MGEGDGAVLAGRVSCRAGWAVADGLTVGRAGPSSRCSGYDVV